MSYRSIHINNAVIKYKIGTSFVNIRFPDGSSHSIFCNEVKGIDPSAYEKGQYKGTNDGMIFPSDVSNYILRNYIHES